MPPCHGGGRGFESRPVRIQTEKALKKLGAFFMCYNVYILYSASADRYYIGQTADINDRLKRHNAGSEKATAPYTPWQLIWTTQKATRAEDKIGVSNMYTN